MKLITKEIENKLIKNLELPEDERKPYLKLFNPTGAATWLISQIEYGSIENGDAIFFGLCDLGMGEPKLGSVAMQELASLRLPFGLSIERDLHWEPTKSLTEYWYESRTNGAISA
tara:strand:- start:4002 stop:4346 length:345 start_codon:yes stop_codon:yes gene_type:complete